MYDCETFPVSVKFLRQLVHHSLALLLHCQNAALSRFGIPELAEFAGYTSGGVDIPGG